VEHSYYRSLAAMTVLSFLSMYALMYSMADGFENIYSNVNQVYMAALMTAPMVVIELSLMGMMYPNRTLNRVIMLSGVITTAVAFLLIRQQAGVTDRQFLRSMIPHHAAAILMCERTVLEDVEIQKLCKSIMSGQQAEIEQMRAKLQELDQ
jgi:uncharacterized protein (DUF305 family)